MRVGQGGRSGKKWERGRNTSTLLHKSTFKEEASSSRVKLPLTIQYSPPPSQTHAPITSGCKVYWSTGHWGTGAEYTYMILSLAK